MILEVSQCRSGGSDGLVDVRHQPQSLRTTRYFAAWSSRHAPYWALGIVHCHVWSPSTFQNLRQFWAHWRSGPLGQGVPLNHPFLDGIFLYKPTIFRYHQINRNPHMNPEFQHASNILLPLSGSIWLFLNTILLGSWLRLVVAIPDIQPFDLVYPFLLANARIQNVFHSCSFYAG